MFFHVDVKSYSLKDCTVEEPCKTTGFCCRIGDNGKTTLKTEHKYYAQVQGQMALGERSWCDFVIYTMKDIENFL